MLGRIINILLSFLVACFAAGLTKVLFATTPSELAGLHPDVAADRISKVIESGLFAAVISAIFAAPFALVAAAVSEWRRLRSLTYYALSGLGIALIGFLAHYSAEAQGAPTIVNNYALTAFLTAGFVGGLTYWLLHGRHAGIDPVPHRTTTGAMGGSAGASNDKNKPKMASGSTVPNTGSGAPRKA